jgi:hypothetical protein
MRITKATKQAIRYACLNFHYAKAVPVNPIGYNIYNDNDEWCGCILYGFGANCNIGAEYNLSQGQVLELTRVALNGKQECTSQALALSIKRIKKDCPLCKLLVSYADCDQEHLGTIYQATNWIYTGRNGQGNKAGYIVNGKKVHTRTIWEWKVNVDGKMVHCPYDIDIIRANFDPNAIELVTKGKLKYLMPLDKKTRKQVQHLHHPYPKNDGWVKIDRHSFVKEDDSVLQSNV